MLSRNDVRIVGARGRSRRPIAYTVRVDASAYAMKWFLSVVAVGMLGWAVAITVAGAQEPAQQKDNAWMRSWIPVSCCVTNDCCYKIDAKEVQPVGEDKWQVKQTGQVVKRTDWSPDGQYYRCACSLKDGQYVQDRSAHTYCIFPPMQTVMAGERG
jgi:hypothetical protein